MTRDLRSLTCVALSLVLWTWTGCTGSVLEPADDEGADDDVADDDVTDDDVADDDVADDDTAAGCWTVDLGDGSGSYTHALGSSEGFEFPMDSGVSVLVATLTWASDEVWDFSLSVGARTCHDVQWATAHGDSGEVVLEIIASDTPGSPSTFPIGLNTYADIKLHDSGDHEVGDAVDYEFTVELCNYL